MVWRVPVLRGCVLYVCCYVSIMLFSSILAITERKDMGLYEVPLCMNLSLGWGLY